MTALAPTLQAFFTDRLRQQRHASDETVRAYRGTWRDGLVAARLLFTKLARTRMLTDAESAIPVAPAT